MSVETASLTYSESLISDIFPNPDEQVDGRKKFIYVCIQGGMDNGFTVGFDPTGPSLHVGH